MGVIFLILGVLGVATWWLEFGMVMRGLVPLLLIIVGLVAIASTLSLLTEKGAAGGKPVKERR
jgi:hypothetical protein